MALYLKTPSAVSVTAYSRNRTTFRTLLRPLGLRDPQQDRPYVWCDRCGAEVYRPDTLLCRRCSKSDD